MAGFRLKRSNAQRLCRDLPHLIPGERNARSQSDKHNQQQRCRRSSQPDVHQHVARRSITPNPAEN